MCLYIVYLYTMEDAIQIINTRIFVITRAFFRAVCSPRSHLRRGRGLGKREIEFRAIHLVFVARCVAR